jgi:bud emergence protein 1
MPGFILSGKPLDPTVVDEMIRGGALPPVEEWKKSTAEYKQASIPLGRFDFSGPPPTTSGAPSMGLSASQPNASSPPNPGRPAASPTHTRQQSAGGRQVSSHYETTDRSLLTPAYPPALTSHSTPALGGGGTARSSSPPTNERYSQSTGRSRHSTDPPQRKYDLVTQASVESFHFEENAFWFHVRASFASGASLVLYRLYQDFYDFQIALMDEFPVEAGRKPAQSGGVARRIIPKMPGPVKEVDEVICAQRVGDLGDYLKQLCQLPQYMLRHALFYEFLAPKPGDLEVSVPSNSSNARTSYDERGGGENYGVDEDVEYLHRMANGVEEGLAREMGATGLDEQQQQQQQPHSPSRSSSSGQQRDSSGGGGPARYSARSGSLPSSSRPADFAVGGGASTPHTSSSSRPAERTSNTQSPPLSSTSNQPPFVKIKIFHRNTDDLIALRVPPTVSRASLLEKVRDRLGGDVTKLRFREESPGSGSGGPAVSSGARLIEVANDVDLDRWIRGGSRLVLYAD